MARSDGRRHGCGRKSVPKVCNGRRCGTDDIHYIESNLIRRYASAAGVICPGANHGTTFLVGDGAIRGTEVGSCAGLHFDEYERIAVPSDEIRFGGPGGSPVIARHDCHALTLEVAMRNVFTASSERQAGVPLPATAAVTGQIGDMEEG